MTEYVTRRTRFFDHQFLRLGEFQTEQEYLDARRLDHNRGFHTAGVVEGLKVSFTNTAMTQIRVSKGWATDNPGREIILAQDRTIDVTPGQDRDVWIAWRATDVVPSADPGTVGEMTRTDDDPIVVVDNTAPNQDAVRLARIEGGAIKTTSAIRQESELLDDSVLSQHIAAADNASGQDTTSGAGVKTDHLAHEAVTSAKLAKAPATGNSQDTATGSGVKTDHLANDAVTSAKLASAPATGNSQNTASGTGVKTNHLANEAVTSAKLATAPATGNSQDTNSGSGVKTNHLANRAVTSAKLALADNDPTVAQDTSQGSGVKEGHLTDGAVTVAKLADGAVTLDKLAPGLNVGLVEGFFTYDAADLNGWGRLGNNRNVDNVEKAIRWVPFPGIPGPVPLPGRLIAKWSKDISATIVAYAYDAASAKTLSVRVLQIARDAVELLIVDDAGVPQDGVITVLVMNE